MLKLKKVLTLILIVMIFLSQNVAFCFPEKDSTLRPPMKFNNLVNEQEALSIVKRFEKEGRHYSDSNNVGEIEKSTDELFDIISEISELERGFLFSEVRRRLEKILTESESDTVKWYLFQMLELISSRESLPFLTKIIKERWSDYFDDEGKPDENNYLKYAVAAAKNIYSIHGKVDQNLINYLESCLYKNGHWHDTSFRNTALDFLEGLGAATNDRKGIVYAVSITEWTKERHEGFTHHTTSEDYIKEVFDFIKDIPKDERPKQLEKTRLVFEGVMDSRLFEYKAVKALGLICAEESFPKLVELAKKSYPQFGMDYYIYERRLEYTLMVLKEIALEHKHLLASEDFKKVSAAKHYRTRNIEIKNIAREIRRAI